MRGNGFEDSTGQRWFPEATAFLRGKEFKFVDLSDLTSYLLFVCLLQHKNVQSCRYLQRCVIKYRCDFSCDSLDIKKIKVVANIEVLLVESSTIKTAHLVSKII